MQKSTKWTIIGVVGGLTAEALLAYYFWNEEYKNRAFVYKANVLPTDNSPPFSKVTCGGTGGWQSEFYPITETIEGGTLHMVSDAPPANPVKCSLYGIMLPPPNKPDADIGYTYIVKIKIGKCGGNFNAPEPVVGVRDRFGPLGFYGGNYAPTQSRKITLSGVGNSFSVPWSDFFTVRIAIKTNLATNQREGRLWINDVLKYEGVWGNGITAMIDPTNDLFFGFNQSACEMWLDYLILDGHGAFSPEEKPDSFYLG